MHIERASVITDDIFDAVRRLVPYLGTHKPLPGREDLERLLEGGHSTLLLARPADEHSLVAGMLTITIYRVPTGVRSIVEDVVVDERFRGRGIAKGLMNEAIRLAREAGASGISLTSNPQRVEANRLYQSLGFQKRETNAYFLDLK
jgi:ribosomal protein S18 acetylase RimI-like enzyme